MPGGTTGHTLQGRALAFGGLFPDAYANAALSAGPGPMTEQMKLTSTQISVLPATAPFLAILFNPVGGWPATRMGRVPPTADREGLRGRRALPAAFSGDFTTVWFGRVLVGVAYGVDFAVAMALLAEYTPEGQQRAARSLAGRPVRRADP